MSKVDIKRLDSITKNDTTATEQINGNFKALQEAIENTVSRDGTVPNYMDADLDLNSYRIINVGDPVGERDVVTLKYFEEKAGGAVEAAAEAKANASKAASSAQSALVASNNAIGQVAKAEGLLIAAKGQLENAKQYVDASKADIKSAVDEAEMNIKDIVTDAEGSITNIAVTEAKKAIANSAQEATDIATANVNNYVNSTIKPPLQNYINQAQENANSAATSMEQAALSAKAASNYASNASADADNAAESAGLAANSAAAAATSKTNAKTSETNAKIWAEGTDAQVQALGGVKSAKGWAEASTNLDYTNITNCITKIPQDIKLELENGTLTLKAGSKVYVPNGVGKFDVVTIASDIKYTYTFVPSSDTFMMLFINQSGTAFVNSRLESSCFSGKTQPKGRYINWYNTEENRMYSIAENSTINDSGFSFPIARIIQGSDGVTKSIDQVFNGFGYIGSTVFALPGVEGLIPNGRNEDGSLNNIKLTTTSVFTYTPTTGTYDVLLTLASDSFSWDSSDRYDAENNYNINDAGIISQLILGYANVVSGKITSFSPKTSFHAVDYYDYAREVDNTVHKTGNENISGRKTFNGSGIGIIKSGSAIDIQNTAVDLSVTDGSVYGTTEIQLRDKNNKVQGIFEHQNTTDGKSVALIAARNHTNTKWTSVEVGFDANNVTYTVAPTPPADSNDSNIATTAWVRNYSKNYGTQLNYAAAVIISGTGDKTAPASGVLIMTGTGISGPGEFRITIDGQMFTCFQGYRNVDYNHATFAYFPVKSGQEYTVNILSGGCDLRFIPYQ